MDNSTNSVANEAMIRSVQIVKTQQKKDRSDMTKGTSRVDETHSEYVQVDDRSNN